MAQILIQPIGKVDPELINWLEASLPKVFNAHVEILKAIRIAQTCYHPGRGQYNSTCLLRKLKPVRVTLGVTEVDIFADGMNFVFGEAELGGARAIVSVYRLWSPDKDKVKERLLKEAVHEIGHVLGLRHCSNMRCVMSFSNSVVEVDRKSVDFCKLCVRRIKY